MANRLEYPLEKIIEIKKRRVDEQIKVVVQREKELKNEQDTLRQREEERDKVVRHKRDKLNQLRDELDKGTTTDKIIQMKVYLKVVEERVKVEEKKVFDQKEKVKVAEKNLDVAKEELRIKRLEVDKLNSHKIDWVKERKRELEAEEEKAMEEVGQTLYTIHRKRGY